MDGELMSTATLQRTTGRTGAKCAATSKDGSACTHWPLAGGTKCRQHSKGFRSPKYGRQVNIEFARAREALLQLQVSVDMAKVDPRLVLLENVARSHQMVSFTHELVSSLTVDDFTDLGSLPLPGEMWMVDVDRRGPRAEVFLRLQGEWLERSSKVSKMALDAGIEERVVQLYEQQAALMAGAMRRLVEGLVARFGLNDDFQKAAIQMAADELRQLSSAGAKNVTPSNQAALVQELIHG